MQIVKDLYRSPFFFIFRMGSVILAAKFIFSSFSEIDFNWYEESLNIGLWIIIFYVIYVVASVIPPSDSESTPLFIQGHIRKTINDQYMYSGRPIKEARGLYLDTPKFIDSVFYYEYNPILNPIEVIHKSEANIKILESLNTGEADKLIIYLEKVIKEAKYMLDNECTTLLIKQ